MCGGGGGCRRRGTQESPSCLPSRAQCTSVSLELGRDQQAAQKVGTCQRRSRRILTDPPAQGPGAKPALGRSTGDGAHLTQPRKRGPWGGSRAHTTSLLPTPHTSPSMSCCSPGSLPSVTQHPASSQSLRPMLSEGGSPHSISAARRQPALFFELTDAYIGPSTMERKDS